MNEVTPKVSVIIPCYNIAAYIDRCLKSILEQDYGFDNLEVILVDDHSGDDTLLHLESFESSHSDNVVLIGNGENCGPGTARNIGMQYASGEYILFADGDDILAPGLISELMKLSLRYDSDISECSYGLFDATEKIVYEDGGEETYTEISDEADRRSFLLKSLKTAVWGRLYKRRFIEENDIFFPEGVYNLEDVFFSGLAMLSIKRYCRTEKKLYWYFVNSKGLDRSPYDGEKMRKEILIIDMLLNEITGREDLAGKQNLKEFEFYCIWKGLLDPLRKILRTYSDNDAMLSEALHYAHHINGLFPDAHENIYLQNLESDESKLALRLLRFSKGGN